MTDAKPSNIKFYKNFDALVAKKRKEKAEANPVWNADGSTRPSIWNDDGSLREDLESFVEENITEAR